MCGKEAELVERSRSKAELQGAALGAARVPPAPVARGAKSQKISKKSPTAAGLGCTGTRNTS